MTEAVGALVDGLFRQQSARLTSIVLRVFGPRHLPLAEEVVQEALLRALQRWPVSGVPADPEAWLMTVARNAALDAVRRERTLATHAGDVVRAFERAESAHTPASSISDDELAMLFMTAHPSLSRDSRVALMLKVAGGLSVPEIARALIADERAIAQRLVRAKRTLRDGAGGPIELPPDRELRERLDSVLEAIYLMFSEGHRPQEASAGPRIDLSAEAIRLARLLSRHPLTARPETHALVAMMLFHAARFAARGGAADLALLADQDRARWDRELIAEAFLALDRSVGGEALTSWHVEAAIAAVHVAAPTFEDTDWIRLVSLYDDLLRLNPSPVVALNRAIAIWHAGGPADGLDALPAESDPAMARYYLFHAARAGMLAALGRDDAARETYRRAIALTPTPAERRLLESRLSALR